MPQKTSKRLERELQAGGWIAVTERLPEVALGTEEQVWVCAQRSNGKRYVFIHNYVNRPEPGEEEHPDWALNCEYAPSGYIGIVGWAHAGCHPEYDEYFQPDDAPEEIIAWMPLTPPPPPGQDTPVATVSEPHEQSAVVRALEEAAVSCDILAKVGGESGRAAARCARVVRALAEKERKS